MANPLFTNPFSYDPRSSSPGSPRDRAKGPPLGTGATTGVRSATRHRRALTGRLILANLDTAAADLDLERSSRLPDCAPAASRPG